MNGAYKKLKVFIKWSTNQKDCIDYIKSFIRTSM